MRKWGATGPDHLLAVPSLGHVSHHILHVQARLWAASFDLLWSFNAVLPLP